MAAANNEFFEALSMLEHERGITAEYLIDKIKAAIVIAVKKNYEVEDDHVMVEIDPNTGKFNVALIQDVVADEDWYDEHSEIGITEAQHIRKSYQVGDRVVTPLKTKDFGRIAAQTAKHVIRQGIREAERSQQLSEIQSRAHDIVQATVTRVDPEKGIVALDLGKGGEAILPRNEQVPFKDGRVVEHGADEGADLLGQLLDTDEGARSIGEVALVPASSPINRSGALFYSTLFDENAACHIAFGASYPGTTENGTRLTKDELLARGMNQSAIHEDVMVGAEDSHITGKCRDGHTVDLFRDGVWVL